MSRVKCQKLTRRRLDNALAALDPEDRQRILRMAAKIEEKIKEDSMGKVMFGRLSALELIAIAGIFCIKNDIYSLDLPERLIDR